MKAGIPPATDRRAEAIAGCQTSLRRLDRRPAASPSLAPFDFAERARAAYNLRWLLGELRAVRRHL